jgi:hypothetical protein
MRTTPITVNPLSTFLGEFHPEARKEKVFTEIRRPVFSLLERAPLAERCTYISYDSLRELAKLPHLAHTSDSVLTEYEEEAE